MISVRTERFPNCIICGSIGELLYEGLRDRFSIVDGNFNLRFCPSCRLAWLDPRPIAADIGKCYTGSRSEEEAFGPDIAPDSKILAAIKRVIRASVLCGHFGYRHVHKHHILCKVGPLIARTPLLGPASAYQLGGLLPHSKAKERSFVIDIGAGYGEYLEFMRYLGWKVLGVETDPVAVAVLKKKNIPVFNGTFEELKMPDSSADMITLHHVMEHMPDPISLTRECYRVLRPGGELGMHVPNIDSMAHKMFGRNCFHLEPPRHLFTFSPESMRRILGKIPFKAFHITTSPSLARNYYNCSMIVAKEGKIRKDYKPQKGCGFFSAKEYFLCALGCGCGEEVEVVAIK